MTDQGAAQFQPDDVWKRNDCLVPHVYFYVAGHEEPLHFGMVKLYFSAGCCRAFWGYYLPSNTENFWLFERDGIQFPPP